MRCSNSRHTGSLEVARFALFILNLGPRMSVYGLLLVCKQSEFSNHGTTAYVYSAS